MTIRHNRYYEVWHPTSRNRQIRVSLAPVPGSNDLALESPYDAGFVDKFKRVVPGSGRRWDKDGKRWLISPAHAAAVIALVRATWGIDLALPATSAAVTETRVEQLEYLGAAKPRAGWDELVSYGYCDDDWRLAFPVSVLLAWFMPGDARPSEATTLYGVLGVSRAAQADEVKRAYRRAARTWHPDVCHEPDAAEQFKRLNHAYSVLSDDVLRRKYDVGLQLTERAREALPLGTGDTTWRPPLRCGLVMVEGRTQVGRFVVDHIRAWEDIVNERGQVLVTTWLPGMDKFTKTWREA